jgi:DNA-directed RNA polymerase subunit RPC12/RpoP
MRAEKQIKLNEWLLGSTILCQSCGCLWLVPEPQTGEEYKCRQCGSTVTIKARTDSLEDSTKASRSNF